MSSTAAAAVSTCAEVSLSDGGALSSTGAKLGAAWNAGRNSVLAFPSKRATTLAVRPGLSVDMHLVEWETTLYSPIMRKLVNESAQAFALQKIAREEGDVVGNAHLVRISRQYRSIMRDCQQQLDAEAEIETAAAPAASASATPPAKADFYVQQSELMYKLELIWNLVEIVCIEKPPNGMILPQLLQWISLHFPRAEELTRDVLSEHPESPEVGPEYWDAITLFVLQGRTDQAQKLLRLHSEFGSESFVSLDELLRKMPVYPGGVGGGAGAAGMSSVDFDFRWKHWQREVNARIDEGDFAGDVNLNRLAAVLAGSEQVFNTELVEQCESWYQWMIGKLLFTQPDVKKFELGAAAEHAINKFGGLSRMTSLDSVLLAVMESDLAQVMHELCTTLDNFWFPAHLLDLLHHADEIDHLGHHQQPPQQQQPGGSSGGGETAQPGPGLREFLLLDYASCLMSHRSLWQLGVLYLDNCPVQGLFRLELLLERVPVLESERKANKVIGLAAERGLSSVVTQTCKVMGMRALKEDRIGAAMSWALRSQDVSFATFLADRLLHEYTTSGGFASSADLLDHLGTSMVLSDRLTFLAKYREFHRLCEHGEFKTAADLLHSLMWSRLAPKYFWVTLLVDALPFISCETVASEGALLNSEQTYELMHCLQELVKDESLPKQQRAMLGQHEPKIRMELARNLAVALMDEGDES